MQWICLLGFVEHPWGLTCSVMMTSLLPILITPATLFGKYYSYEKICEKAQLASG